MTMDNDNADTVESPSADQPAAPSVKRRNPIERILVWGSIGALLVLVGVESRAKFGYGKALATLRELSDVNEQTGEEFSISDVRERLSGGFAESDPVEGGYYAPFADVKYSWYSLFKPGEYEISARFSMYDGNSVFMTFVTANAPPVVEPAPMTAAELIRAHEHAEAQLANYIETFGEVQNSGGENGSRDSDGLAGLLSEDAVRQSLGMTEQQVDVLSEIAQSFADSGPPTDSDRAALADSIRVELGDELFGRAQAILIRRRGTTAIGRPDVAARFGLSDSQRQDFETKLSGQREQRNALPRMTADARREAIQSMDDVLLSVFTDEQRATWDELIADGNDDPPRPEQQPTGERPDNRRPPLDSSESPAEDDAVGEQ